MYVCTYVRMHACMYVCMYVCMLPSLVVKRLGSFSKSFVPNIMPLEEISTQFFSFLQTVTGERRAPEIMTGKLH
jgi:hypothetical protein